MALVLVTITCLEHTAALDTKQVLQTPLVNEWMLVSQSSKLDWDILQAKVVTPLCYTRGTAFTGGLPVGRGVTVSWPLKETTPCLSPSFLLRFPPSNLDQSRSREGHLGLTLFALNPRWLSSAAAKANTVRSFMQAAPVFWTKLRCYLYTKPHVGQSQGKKPKSQNSNSNSNKVRAPARSLILLVGLEEPNRTTASASVKTQTAGIAGVLRISVIPKCFWGAQKSQLLTIKCSNNTESFNKESFENIITLIDHRHR